MPLMDIREIIKHELRRQDMTQMQLAALAQMTIPRVSDYLTGKRDVYAETLRRMLTSLGLEIVPAKRPAARRKATASLRATQKNQTGQRSGKRKGK